MNAFQIGMAATEEVARAENKHPKWPVDIFGALAIVGEEVGELNQAALKATYEMQWNKPEAADDFKDRVEHIKEEAVQSIAVLIRFLKNFDQYDLKKGKEMK